MRKRIAIKLGLAVLMAVGVMWLLTGTAQAQGDPVSCLDILRSGGSIGDGVYTIDPDGAGGQDPVQVYCDMTTDGGGWTLVGSTRDTTFNDQSSTYYDDLATLSPAAAHEGIWDGLRFMTVDVWSDIRFSCRNQDYAGPFDVDLAFYEMPWYAEITASTDDTAVCFEEQDGAGQTLPPPARQNLLTGQSLPLGNQWNAGYLEGEDSCSDTGDFTVDFDDRGMDNNQSDGTDWGEDDSSRKCAQDGISGGTWFVWVREPIGVFLQPSLAEGFGEVGDTVVHTETVLNLTGQDDSFDLTVSGNAWPTTLSMANTGLVGSGEAVTFTVQVDIPAGTDPGDADVATVVATSVLSPTDFADTAEVTTLALSGHTGYVFDNDHHKIHIVDPLVHIQIGSIDTTSYGYDPLRGAISPDGAWLYVGLEDSYAVLVVDTATNTPLTALGVGEGPHGIAFSADGAYAFVANQWDDTVSVIDTSVPTVTLTIPVGTRPLSVASSPCLDKVYVTNHDEGTVSVIDVATLSVVETIPGLDNPWDIVISPYGHLAYVSDQGAGSIAVIDTLNDRLIAAWSIQGDWIAGLDIAPDGEELYVADADAGWTYVVDTSTGAVVATIPTSPYERTTWEVEVFPAWAGPFAYVSNPFDDEVKVIDTDTHTVIDKIVLDGDPRGFALFPPEAACSTGMVELAPGAAKAYGDTGTTVVYTETVFNLTGATDSFALAAAGSAWPTTLSASNTGPLPDRSSFTVAVEVEVPAGAPPGALDEVTVTATSVSNPAMYSDTATLTTVALSGQRGYVFDLYQQEIYIVDPLLHLDTGSSIALSAYGDPRQGALSPDGKWLVAGLRMGNEVVVISTTTNTPITAVPVGNNPFVGGFSADGAYAFIANHGSSTVSVIDTSQWVVTATIPVGSGPQKVAISPCLDKGYVVNLYDHTVSVIDLNTFSVLTTISGFYGPHDVVISPYGHRAYVSNTNGGTIGVIDTTTDALIATWDVSGGDRLAELDISRDGGTLYVGARWDGDTYVVNAITGEVIARIPTGNVWGVEAFPEWAGPFVYVSNVNDGRVTVLDGNTNTIFSTIRLGVEPQGLALFPPETACRSDVLILPSGASRFGEAGSTVVYTETVVNMTGADDSFDLAAAGNGWPTTLSIPNTGVIPYGDWIAFTVEVDVPAGAIAGATDVAEVTATSDTSPAVYTDTANLTTVAASGQYGYAFNDESDVIHVLDTVLHQEVDRIDVTPYGDDPLRGALSPDGAWLYVGLEDSSAVLVVDTATNMPVTPTIPVGNGPHGIAFSSDGAYAFVPNQWDDTVSVIDTGVPTVTRTISVGMRPLSVAGSPCLDKVYVTNRDEGTVSVIDVATLTETHVIEGLDYPWDIVVSPLGDRAYVSNQGASGNPGIPSIGVIDTASDSVVATWPIDGYWIAGLDISADGHTLYVADANAGLTYAIDTATGDVVASIFTSPDEGVTWELEAFPAAAGPFAYVTNPYDGAVKVIDTTTNSVADEILLGGNPRGLALFPPETACGELPAADFSPKMSTIAQGDTVTFDNLSTGVPTPSYLWDFGDGSPKSTAEDPVHVYDLAGSFTVVLTATNVFGWDVVTGTVEVFEPPTAAFAPTSIAIRPGDTVAFTNLSIGEPPLSYIWDFGDGTPTSTEVNPTHPYDAVGTFTVLLTVSNAYGEDTATGTVQVTSYALYLPLLLRSY